MSANTIESGFTYQLEVCVRDFCKDFDTIDQALECYLEEPDGDFARTLLNHAEDWTDIKALFEKLKGEKDA